MKEKEYLILQGDALEKLKEIPDNTIDCVMTSPPYWNLRDYDDENQLGLEETPDEYINNLCNIFDEVKRVLKESGTCWVNIGDTYAGSGKGVGGKKRFTVDFEKIFFFVKNSKKYFFETQYEPLSESSIKDIKKRKITNDFKVPYSIQPRDKDLVEYRNLPDLDKFGSFLNDKRKESGYSMVVKHHLNQA